MKDMEVHLEKLLNDAEECALISKLATDMAKREDVVHSGGNSLVRTNTGMFTLSYKLNKWVSFVNEVTYYQTNTAWTRTAAGEAVRVTKKYEGQNRTAAHNWINEFGTVVTF